MLKQIKQLSDFNDREYCNKVLCITTIAYYSLHLKEFNFAADLPNKEFADTVNLSDLINQCGSFLTIRDEVIYFMHQSAKEFLSGPEGSHVFPTI